MSLNNFLSSHCIAVSPTHHLDISLPATREEVQQDVQHRALSFFAGVYRLIFNRAPHLAPHAYELFYFFTLSWVINDYLRNEINSFALHLTMPYALDYLQDGIDLALKDYRRSNHCEIIRWEDEDGNEAKTHKQFQHAHPIYAAVYPPLPTSLFSLGTTISELFRTAPSNFSHRERRTRQRDTFRLGVSLSMSSRNLWIIRSLALLENPNACAAPSSRWGQFIEWARFQWGILCPTHDYTRTVRRFYKKWSWLDGFDNGGFFFCDTTCSTPQNLKARLLSQCVKG